MNIGLLLREARKIKNYTAENIAESLGVTTPTVTRWENGGIDMPTSVLVRYCDAIEITLTELFAGKRMALPILGTIRAGVPIMAQETYDGHLELPESLSADFALRVTGASMIGVGILEGDYAICRESLEPQTGQIIVALRTEGSFSEATLKFYFNGKDKPVLRAANPSYSDIDFRDGYHCAGHMVALIREDSPGYQVYRDCLTIAGYEEWTQVIEFATGKGLTPKDLIYMIDMQTRISERMIREKQSSPPTRKLRPMNAQKKIDLNKIEPAPTNKRKLRLDKLEE